MSFGPVTAVFESVVADTLRDMYGHPEFDLFEAIYTTRAMPAVEARSRAAGDYHEDPRSCHYGAFEQQPPTVDFHRGTLSGHQAIRRRTLPTSVGKKLFHAR